MRLLVNRLHHGPRLEEVVRALQFRLAARRGYVDRVPKHVRLLLGLDCSHRRVVFHVDTGLGETELACAIVLTDLLLEIVLIHLLSCEESLCLVLQCLHESFRLEVRVEAHGRPDLFLLLPWSHLPRAPLGLCRRAIDKAVAFEGCLDAFSIGERRSKVHPWRPHHLALVLHLGEALAVVVRLCHRLHSHLLDERGHSRLVIGDEVVTSAL